MFCNNCGSKISDGEMFCGECGTPVTKIVTQQDATVMAQATAPTAPVQPVAPVQPAAPVQQPVAPVQPAVSVQPVQSTPAAPTYTTATAMAQPTAPVQPTAPAAGNALVTKKKKKWIIPVVIGAVVIVLGGIIASLFAFGAVDKVNSRMKMATAEKYFSNDDYDNAIAYYKDAIEIDPENVEAYLGLADVYIAMDDYANAIALLENGFAITDSHAIEQRLDELYDESRRIYGHVYKVDVDTDPNNNEPLEGATVEISFPDGDTKTYTVDENGYYETETGIPDGKYEIKYAYNSEFMTYEEDFKADKGEVLKDIYLEPVGYAELFGTVLIGDEDTDYTNNIPLVAATVTIEKINSSHKYQGTIETDANGEFKFEGLLMGVYKLTIKCIGFSEVVQNITVYEGQTEVYNPVVELISEEYKGKGYATGKIYNALTGDGIVGLSLYIREGINNTDGAIVDTAKTGEDGVYTTPGLKSGNYCIEVVDERGVDELPYISTYFNVKVLGGITIDNQSATVTGSLGNGQLRIVLTWGLSPYDLDSHLLSYIDGRYNEVYFADEYYSIGGVDVADLDLDDTESYGPETTTIYTPMDGDYMFYVYNYSGGSESGLSNSGATVMVYTEGAVKPDYVFYVPAGAGYSWAVFNYDSKTQTIEPINKISMYADYFYNEYTGKWDIQ